MNNSTILKRGEKHVFNEVDGELVMMNIETGEYISMNSTGKAIWNLLENETSLENLLSSLEKDYDVDSEILSKDVLPFIEKLRKKDILI